MTAPQPKPVHLVTAAVSASCGKCGARPEPVHVLFSSTDKTRFYCAECCRYCCPWKWPAPERSATV